MKGGRKEMKEEGKERQEIRKGLKLSFLKI